MMIFAACKRENAFDCFKSTGKEITETRYPGGFKQLELDANMEITISKGTEFKLEVEAGKNVIKNISTKVINNVLMIDNNNKCNFVRGYKRTVKINVTVPYISSVFNNGVGTIRFSSAFTQDSLVVKAENSGDIYVSGAYHYIKSSSHGNGDIYMSGTCDTLYVYTNGINYLKAENLLVSDYIFIETLSIGDCYINATNLERFDYNIRKDGNIYYSGTPQIIGNYSDGTGKGGLIHEN